MVASKKKKKKRKATKPNNSPLSFLVGLLLYSFRSPGAAIWADSPGSLTGCLGKAYSLSAICEKLPANRMWPHRQETYIYGFLASKKKKGGKEKEDVQETERGLFVFLVALIAAQSTGNRRSEALRNVISDWLQQWRAWVIALWEQVSSECTCVAEKGQVMGKLRRISFHLACFKMLGDFRGAHRGIF